MRQQRRIVLSLVGLLAVVAGCGSSAASAGATASATSSAGLPSAGASLVPSQGPSQIASEHGTFSAAGTLGVSLETATVLADGRVLLAAGVSCTSDSLCDNTAQARLFDPTTNSFSVVGPLAAARSELAVVALDDGSALIAGGSDQPATELFSKPTGGFSPAGSMSTDRRGLAAAGLSNGRVLIAGGWGGPRGNISTFASAEIYDSAANSFSATGAMNVARTGHTATTLKDGTVLIVGGRGKYPNDGLASAEIYDPSTGRFTLTGSLTAARQNHTALRLSDSRVLVVGGEKGVVGTTLIEIYDPGTGKFSQAGTLPAPLVGVSATQLKDGRVLIAGGRSVANDDEALTTNAVAGAYLFDPSTGTLAPTGPMTVARERHTATLLNDGRVLIAGGWNEAGQVGSAEFYQP